jgi:nucleotide-binding universal stress UspA family protein
MKTILCPIDFSDSSKAAVKFGAQLAIKSSAQLVILHVYQVPYDFATRQHEVSYRLSEHSYKELEKIKNDIIDDPKYRDLDYRIITQPGEAVYAILHQAVKEEADLIIMGVRGNSSAINHAILGSTTFEVARLASMPVLSVPSTVEFENINKLIFSIDYKEEDLNTVLRLKDLAKVFGATIDVIHVAERDSLYEKILFKGFKEIVRENIDLEMLEFHLLFHEDFYEGIRNFILHQKEAVLVMTHYKRSFPGILFSKSITESMIKGAAMPVLVYNA